MDPALVGYVSYRRHRICNPYSLEQLRRVLAYSDLQTGDRAVDLGCGAGVASCWMARHHGLDLTAVERFAPVAALARAEAERPLGRGRVTVVEGAASEHLAGAGEHRLVSALGAVELFPGLSRPAETMAALVPSIAPGGWLLWGDPFWKKAPSPALAQAFGAETYESLAGWAAAGEAAGLELRHMAVSDEADWEAFFWTMNASLEDWAAENPGRAEAGAIRARAAMLRRLYLEEQREGMGFGLYLFRRPAA